MNKTLEDNLNVIITEYQDCHSQKALPRGIPEKFKANCISALTARMEVLNRKNPEDAEEYRECSFLMHALQNGWLVSDIPSLRQIYATVQNLEAGPAKSKGEDLIDHIATVPADTLTRRNEVALYTQNYFGELRLDAKTRSDKLLLSEIVKEFNDRVVYPTEYPKDRNFTDNLGYDEQAASYRFNSILSNHDKSSEFYNELDRNLRTKDNYIIGAVTDEEREARNRSFEPNPAQKTHKMSKSSSKAVSEIVGADVYDEINEMSRGKASDRTVSLKHSLGTAYQKQGHDVIELEFAGSSAHDVMKKHKGRNGAIDKKLSPEDYKERYGTKAKRKNGTEFDYIHYQERDLPLPDGKNAKKTRYTFGGATPDVPLFPGIINMGEYSIESCRENARDFVKDKLLPQFENWRLGKEEPKSINILLNGISRGAVAAGQSAKKINAWIDSYIAKHPECGDFKKFVNYDLTMIDPVPGFMTNLHMGHVTLDGIPNMNATVFCSLGIVQPDMLFPLQQVNGAKRIVLTMTDHVMDTDKVDRTQDGAMGRDKKHALGYFDAETGEMYRGSGLNQLPDGVYVADENHNLVRLTSYSQVKDLFQTVYDKTSPQKIRCRNIHRMVRDWFLKNELQMSFRDEDARRAAKLKINAAEDRLLQYEDPALQKVRDELLTLRNDETAGRDEAVLAARNDKLIAACRAYMKDISMPPSGETADKMGLVSDVLSHAMREKNYLNKAIGLRNGENRESELDRKIRNHRERLENKDGYLERKMKLESERLQKEQRLLKFAKDTARLCSESLAMLDETRQGKSTSKSYDRFHDVLEEGAKLGENTSPNELMGFLKKLNQVSDRYSSSHNRIIGPITDDGKTRLNIGQAMTVYGREAEKDMLETANELGEKNVPLGIKLNTREMSLRHIRERQNELNRTEEINVAPNQPEPALAI